MKKTGTPFRVRAEKTIQQAIKLRLFLISTGKSKNEIAPFHCEKVLQDITVLRSDKQFAKYIQENYPLLERMMPGPHEKNKIHLRELHLESPQYL